MNYDSVQLDYEIRASNKTNSKMKNEMEYVSKFPPMTTKHSNEKKIMTGQLTL
jgi:hypothetical protein